MARGVHPPRQMVGFDRWYQAVGRSGSAYRRLVEAAFGPDQYVGQQGFASRDQILALAEATLNGSRGRVLDVGCGAGGPAHCIAARFGCEVIGLDLSEEALGLARASGPPHPRVVAGDAVRLPFGERRFHSALVLDSLASIRAPEAVFGELGRVLEDRGHLGCTAEVGPPLSSTERARFTRTAPPTVIEEQELRARLAASGFEVVDMTDHTLGAAGVARRLANGLVQQRAALTAELGREAVDDLSATLASLAELLGSGRVAEVAVVARRYPSQA